MRVRDLLDWLEEVAPQRYAEPWDNVGLQVGSLDAPLERICCALDVTSRSVAAAIAATCDVLLVHHPLFLEGLRSVRSDRYPERLLQTIIEAHLNLVVAHTNLDAARFGLNWRIAEALGQGETVPIVSSPFAGERTYGGLCVMRVLHTPRSVQSVARHLVTFFSASRYAAVGPLDMVVQKIAVCTGSGGSMIPQALLAGAECFVTGEVRYHDARWAEENGLVVLTFGHFTSERFMVPVLASALREWSRQRGEPLEVFSFDGEADALRWYDGGLHP